MGDTGDAANALKWGFILLVVYLVLKKLNDAFNFLSNIDPTGLQKAADDAVKEAQDKLRADTTSEEDLQEIMQNLEQTGEEAREGIEEQTQRSIDLAEQFSRNDRELVRKLKSNISTLQGRISTLKGQIEEHEQIIEQKKASMTASGCGTIVEGITKHQNLFGIIDLNPHNEICNELRAEIAIHQKTIQELEQSIEAYQQRITALEDEIATIQQ